MASQLAICGQRSINQLHAFSQLLYQYLLEVDVGASVSYAALSTVIGLDVQNDARHYLDRARRRALKRDRRVFDVVRGEGLRRMDDAGAVGVAEGTVKRIRRAAKRGLDVLVTVDLTKLSRTDATRAHVARAQIGLARVFSTESTRKALAASTANQTTLPSMSKAARAALKIFEDSAATPSGT